MRATKTLKYYLPIYLICLGLFACSEAEEESDEIEKPDNSLSQIIDGIETGVPLEIDLIPINPDSISQPTVFSVGPPKVDTANKNVHRVQAPIVSLVSSNIPTKTPGTDDAISPNRIAVEGKKKLCKFSNAIPALSPSFKDNATYNIQYLDVDHGMSSSYIRSIVEADDGRIWFSTWTAGVTIYDGHSFIELDEHAGLVSNYIWVIFKDSKGNLWFGSDGSGVGFYDGNYFTTYNLSEDDATDLVYDIDEDADGNIWFATEGGLVQYDGEYFTTYTEESGLSENSIKSIDADSQGILWIGTYSSGVMKFDGESFIHYSEEQGLSSNWINTIYVDNEDNVWIGTDGSGVCEYDGYSFFTYGTEQGLSGNSITTILEDSYGNLWVGSSEGGMSKYVYSAFIHYTENEGLSNNRVISAMEDSDGNIWIGTYGAGVNKYNEKSFINYTTHQGLAGDIVRCIVEDKNNRLWFGHDNGFSIYNGKIFEHYGVEQGLWNPQIRSMLQDSEGNFWFGTTGSGVTKYNGETFTHYTTENGMSGDIILAMHQDSEGVFWFGTYSGGITRFDGTNFSHLTEENGLASNTILAITEDHEGNVWFGTNGGGAVKWDGKAITHVTSNEGLNGNFIKSLYEDSNGDMWMGTDGTGLNLVKEDTVITFDSKEGMSNEIVYSIIEDYEQNIWASTEYGLNLITFGDSLDYQITNFGKLDGLKGVDFYVNSVCFDNEGKLWWGSGKSLIMLDLNKYERVTEAPEVSLQDITIEQTFLDFRTLKDSVDQGFGYHLNNKQKTDVSDISFSEMIPFTNCPKDLELPYNLDHITFHFSAIDWSAPHKLRYQYKMEGLDPNWSPVLYENWASYNNIPHGSYTFKVRAIGEAELWSDEVEFNIIVHPPWWLTWWAYTLYAILIVLGVFLVVRWRTKKLIENQKILEGLVDKRTNEVVRQKELVELKNREILDSITYAKRIQEAILPAHSYLKKKLKNAFVLYKPKDIVAGDFYWLEQKGDRILLASADCTGHGVPGAMVSVVCNNALNRTVREFNLESPAEILDKVREIVVETFSQHKSDVKDGMDIALVSYNPKTMELEYAGANNNFYLFRDGGYQTIKADKQPIGKYAIIKEFTNHKLQLKEGDTFYIFTDGYVDQFGGPKGKKFKYKPFLELLQSIQKLPLKEQKKFVDDVFMEWKGRYEQIDDICVIGVRVGEK